MRKLKEDEAMLAAAVICFIAALLGSGLWYLLS